MKNLSLIIILVILIKGAFPQCASDYVDTYGVRYCSDPDTISSYQWNSYISETTPNQILISNFYGIPFGVIWCEDTIIADLFCQIDSLFLQPVGYVLVGGYGSLGFSGSGTLLSDSIILNLHYINPNGSQDLCLVYKKGIIVKTNEEIKNEEIVNIWPNPTNCLININQNNIEVSRIEIVNLMGILIKSYPEFKKTIDISALSNGIYFIKITTSENKTIINKILKK